MKTECLGYIVYENKSENLNNKMNVYGELPKGTTVMARLVVDKGLVAVRTYGIKNWYVEHIKTGEVKDVKKLETSYLKGFYGKPVKTVDDWQEELGLDFTN